MYLVFLSCYGKFMLISSQFLRFLPAAFLSDKSEYKRLRTIHLTAHDEFDAHSVHYKGAR